jgi:hypothetical protein
MDTWELIVILFAAIVLVVLIYLFVLSKKPMEEKKIEQKPSIQPAPETEKIAVQPSSAAEVPAEQVPIKQDLAEQVPAEQVLTKEVQTAQAGLPVTPPQIIRETSIVTQKITEPIIAVVKEELPKEVEVTPKQEPSVTPEEEKKTPRRRGRPKGSGKKKPQPVESSTE